jgi:rhodanese-related sulfurtransferase
MLKPFDSPDQVPEPRRIEPAEARALSISGRAVLLDVRDAHLYENAHLESAIALPLAEIAALDGRLPGRIPVSDDPLLVLYCA